MAFASGGPPQEFLTIRRSWPDLELSEDVRGGSKLGDCVKMGRCARGRSAVS